MRLRFPLLLGFTAAAIVELLMATMWFSAPPGTRWLGDTLQDPSDIAVYLSYLHQGAEGSVLLENRYAVEPHARRFDLLWSTGGLIARTSIPPILVHEILRVIFILVLAFAVTAAARKLTRNERDARLGALLAFGGVGSGWAYTVLISSTVGWTLTTPGAADVVTSFGIASVLIGGAHTIISVALLVTGFHLSWQAWEIPRRRTALLAALTIATLTAFHPYFIPTVLIFNILCIFRFRARISSTTLWNGLLVSILAGLPALFVYLPLAFDRVFRDHHLVQNILLLPPILSIPLTLAPFILALTWRWMHRIRLDAREEWLIAWLIAAVACIALPLPWKLKYLEGMGIACVFLTLPAWSALRDWTLKQQPRWLSRVTAVMLLLAASLTPLHLFASQISWISLSPDKTQWFYVSEDTFEAWEWLRTHTDANSIILSDDRWINIWTPAYTNRTVWVGHDHETPDFWTKRSLAQELITTKDGLRVSQILDATPIDYLLLTTSTTQATFPLWLNSAWNTSYQNEKVTILERRRITDALADSDE